MKESDTTLIQLRELCASQQLAVLATEDRCHPYTSLVAFAVTGDQRRFFFATNRDTRKFANMQSNRHVSLLIDNRTNSARDFTHAIAATLLGECRELSGTEKEDALLLYLNKHPGLEGFVTSARCALMEVTVYGCYLVNQFQQVTECHFLDSRRKPLRE